MHLRRDFLIGVGILLLLNLLLALGAIGLLTRMSPAIREIIEENVVSLEACEVMLSVLASGEEEGKLSSRSRQRYYDALERAKNNVTEEVEVPVLDQIEQLSSGALDGEHRAFLGVKNQILELAAINRRAMVEADIEARRLGVAGAWIAAIFSAASLIIGLIVINRLDVRLVKPLMELDDLLTSVKEGNQHRRFTLSRAPTEIRRTFGMLNELLDRLFEEKPEQEEAQPNADIQRAALHYFLETYGRSALILDNQGEVVASNQAALIVLSEAEGQEFRTQLREVPDKKEMENLEVVALNDSGFFCVQKRIVR